MYRLPASVPASQMIGVLERVIQRGRDVIQDSLARVTTNSEEDVELGYSVYTEGMIIERGDEFLEALKPNWVFKEGNLWIFIWSLTHKKQKADPMLDQCNSRYGMNEKNKFATLYKDIMSLSGTPAWESMLNVSNIDKVIEVDLYKVYLLSKAKRQNPESRLQGTAPYRRELLSAIHNLTRTLKAKGADMTTVMIDVQEYLSDKRTKRISSLKTAYFDAGIGVWPLSLNLIHLYQCALGSSYRSVPSQFTTIKRTSASTELTILIPPRKRVNTAFKIKINGRLEFGTWHHYLTQVLVPELTRIIIAAPDDSPLASFYQHIREYFAEVSTVGPLKRISTINSIVNGGSPRNTRRGNGSTSEEEFRGTSVSKRSKSETVLCSMGTLIPSDNTLIEWNTLFVLGTIILRWVSNEFRYESCVLATSILTALESTVANHEVHNVRDPTYMNVDIDEGGNLHIEWECIALLSEEEFKLFFKVDYEDFLQAMPLNLGLALSAYHGMFDSYETEKSTSDKRNYRKVPTAALGSCDVELYKYLGMRLVGSPHQLYQVSTQKFAVSASIWAWAILQDIKPDQLNQYSGVLTVERM